MVTTFQIDKSPWPKRRQNAQKIANCLFKTRPLHKLCIAPNTSAGVQSLGADDDSRSRVTPQSAEISATRTIMQRIRCGDRDQCITILCSTRSLGPSKLEVRPTCRWRNIWSRAEVIH